METRGRSWSSRRRGAGRSGARAEVPSSVSRETPVAPHYGRVQYQERNSRVGGPGTIRFT